MANMVDVRVALFNAYKKESESEFGVEGTSSEGYCELMYPTWWDNNNDIENFCEPYGIMVYSYALGPSRRHYFVKPGIGYTEDYATFIAEDFYAKAVEVINSWME